MYNHVVRLVVLLNLSDPLGGGGGGVSWTLAWVSLLVNTSLFYMTS